MMEKPLLPEFKNVKFFYWMLPIIISFVQFTYLSNALTQIRYEELAESVRNVFWLQHRFIYDGVSNGVGWYSILLFFYNLFGFNIFTAKYVRLFLFTISIFCLAKLLDKYFGKKYGSLILLTVGLSPTILFFNIIQSEYGLDLDFLPIYLLTIDLLPTKKALINYLNHFGFGFLLMFGATIYPTFLFYLPGLILIYLIKILRSANLAFLLTSTLGFITPILLLIITLQNSQTLFQDPKTNTGLFRGGGKFDFNVATTQTNLSKLPGDLFNKGGSYYYESEKSDFSDYFPIISLLTVLALIFLQIKQKEKVVFILVILLTVVFNLGIASFTVDPSHNPGIRRFTPTLAAIYLLFILALLRIPNIKSSKIQRLALGLLLLIPLHHLIVLPINISNLSKQSPYQYQLWFNVKPTPQQSIDTFTNQLLNQNLTLSCQDNKGANVTCRYNEIYATLAGSCTWNHLNCHQILGFDDKKQQFIPLSIDLWNSYYFGH